ncbi:helix-turn-helix transcriptional regulator [Bengtsoniella intestinalis]|uniref:helix-turn-helix domain-containing protein n=1 Tax=Bengtsoniella intestinalis TaxID=3073143 RepID=UPI00391FC52F
MLNEKIKSLRKQRGFTQEELAIRLNVVRQTISKWEKGLSVPDAEMLIKIADFFEVTTSELLGGSVQSSANETEQNEISQQLARINEQLAIKNRRSRIIWKVILGIIIAVVVFNIFMIVISMVSFNNFNDSLNTTITQTYEETIPIE